MSSAAAPADLSPVLPRPSIFISYASENRAAARLLRDTLAASGLDVWYDENELGGGDAWDQKIRRQIRECTYFMPVISAQTEARREGYFRREWRLAVDRSHDMADDVMFLLPVVIDGTGEGGARVPEKFLTVQWLKVPGGVATPALTTLASRLAHGEHVAPAAASRPAFVPPPSAKRIPVHPIKVTLPGSESAHADGPPPMPHFPPRPADQKDNLKYLAEIFWWLLTTAWLLFKRLPRWGRILVAIWLVMSLFKCSGDDSPPEKPKQPRVKTTTVVEEKDAKRLRDASTELEKVANDPANGALGAGIARVGADLARSISKEIAAAAKSDERLAVVPFSFAAKDPASRKFADDVFGLVFGRLTLAQPGRVTVQPTADHTADDATLRSLANVDGSDRLLLARVELADGKPELVVRLLAVQSTAELWSARVPIDPATTAAAAHAITQAVIVALPAKTPTPPPAP